MIDIGINEIFVQFHKWGCQRGQNEWIGEWVKESSNNVRLEEPREARKIRFSMTCKSHPTCFGVTHVELKLWPAETNSNIGIVEATQILLAVSKGHPRVLLESEQRVCDEELQTSENSKLSPILGMTRGRLRSDLSPFNWGRRRYF